MTDYIDKVNFGGTTYDVKDSAAHAALDNKADIDGTYEQMTVGNAEQLVATVGVEDKTPYNFRTAGGSADIGDRLVEKVVGGTVAWNQQLSNGDFSNGTTGWNTYCGTLTVANNVATYEVTELSDDNTQIKELTKRSIAFHKMLISMDVYPAHTKTMSVYIIDYATNTYFSREVTADTWNRVEGILRLQDASRKEQEFQIKLRCSEANGYSIGEQDKLRNVQFIDLTQMFGSTIADYIYSLETANAGAGVAWFRKLFPKPYYAYNAGELMSVQAASHKTVGFNAWDEEWELGYINVANGENANSNNCIRSKNYIPAVPNTSYYFKVPVATSVNMKVVFYDKNKTFISFATRTNETYTTPTNAYFMRFFMSDAYGNTYHNDICINLSWDGERDGEYEPYTLHEYPLDSSLTLRGIPKLDANNELYYDGDEYESDGTVNRRYGVVDLGTLEWFSNSGITNGYWTSLVDGIIVENDNLPSLISKNYMSVARVSDVSTTDKTYRVYATQNYGGFCRIVIHDNAYTDSESFKAAMNGIYLVYELNTPTDETADPYQNPQIVDDFGTEEYVDAGVTATTPTRDVAIPVGHVTQYQANLRAKLEMAPNSPDGDGDYIVRQTNGQNEYVPITFPADELPAAPTSNGTYTLKCTVSGSGTTYSWVSDA